MTLEPLVSIILLLFFIFLLAALIVWLSLELRAMGLRDKEQSRSLEAVAARAASSESQNSGYNSSYDPITDITQGELDLALNTGLDVSSINKKEDKSKKQASRRAKQASKQASKQINKSISKVSHSTSSAAQTKKTPSSKSSAFKTTSFGSSNLTGDAFTQFEEEGRDALDFNSSAEAANLKHDSTLLKPPKPEEDIFSTSERRDDIWLFHTAEVDPVHPAEDMTKFRQPGGIGGTTGESGKSTQKSGLATEQKMQKNSSGSASSPSNVTTEATTEATTKITTEITTPIQPENKLRDTFDKAAVGAETKNNEAINAETKNNEAVSEEDKVVRMTNSSSRIAAERLIVDKELRKTQTEAYEAANAKANNLANDIPVDMPTPKTIIPAKPSEPFQGTVPPIPEGIQQNLKQTLDEVKDNVSSTSKDDYKNYKNLKNTRSLISTNSDDD